MATVSTESFDDEKSTTILWALAEEALGNGSIFYLSQQHTILLSWLDIIIAIKCLEAVIQSKTRVLPQAEGKTRLRLAEGCRIWIGCMLTLTVS